MAIDVSLWSKTALLQLGSSLLKGIFGGMGKKQEDKRMWELYKKRQDWLEKKLKPKKPYSGGRDPVVEAAIFNLFKSRGLTPPRYGGE